MQGEQDFMLIAVLQHCTQSLLLKLIDRLSSWGHVHRNNFSPGGAHHANTGTVEQDRLRVDGRQACSPYPAR
jgi:hypothetical protein